MMRFIKRPRIGVYGGPPVRQSSHDEIHDDLQGRTICLAHRGSLRYASRLLQEIGALRDCGAHIVFLAHHPDTEYVPDGLDIVVAEDAPPLPPSTARVWLVRVVSNVVRNRVRGLYANWTASNPLKRAMERRPIDLIWAVDWPMLKRYSLRARLNGIPILYETLDLYPEQSSMREEDRIREVRSEGRALRRVAGFVTAGEAYADYYVEQHKLTYRPVVRDNASGPRVSAIRPTEPPVSLIFMGALTINRNLPNLVRAMALSSARIRLTLQGEDRLAPQIQDLIRELGVEGRVSIEEPVPPDRLTLAASRHDVGIVSLEPASRNEELASTTKLFTYMSAGLAVIGSDLPGLASVVRRHDIGWLVSGQEPDAWACAFSQIENSPPCVIDDFKRRSLAASEAHSWESQGPGYLNEFRKALPKSIQLRVSVRP